MNFKEEMKTVQIYPSNVFNSAWTLFALPFQIWLWMAILPFRVLHWAMWGEDLNLEKAKERLEKKKKTCGEKKRKETF